MIFHRKKILPVQLVCLSFQLLIRITVNGKRGFIDRNGKIVIEPKFDDVREFGEGLAGVEINGKWGFIDKSGKVIIEPRFDEARWGFSEGLNTVRVGEKWGYINKSGEFVIKPQFDYGHAFTEDRAIINVGNTGMPKHGVIDKSGKLITEQLFEWSDWSFSEGLLNIKINDKWGFIDENGKIIIPAKYNDAHGFSEGLAAVEFSEGKNQWGFINKSGKVVIPAQYKSASYFNDGLAVIELDWKHGYINKQGTIVIKPQFEMAYFFNDGLALIKTDKHLYGFIDRAGKIIVEPIYNMAFSFDDGLGSIAIGKWETKSSGHRSWPVFNGKWGYIDRTGKVIWKPTR